MLKEWPLVAFTILGQTAVGVFVVFLIPLMLFPGAFAGLGDGEVLAPTLSMIDSLMILAVMISFFHLRHPLRARKALSNLKTSWLSREVLTALTFIGLVSLALAVIRFGGRSNGPLTWIIIAGGVSGALFLLSMVKIYMLPAVPVWNRIFTPVSFLFSALLIGTVAASVVLAGSGGSYELTKAAIIAAILLVLLDLSAAALLAPPRGLSVRIPGASLRPHVKNAAYLIHTARLALLAAGLGALTSAWVDGFYTGIAGRKGPWKLILALILILAGEAAGRVFFYSLVPRTRD